jgi:hypothetical protein
MDSPHRIGINVLILAAFLFAACGCGGGKPATDRELDAVQAEYGPPPGQVGRVVEVLESANLAAVEEIPLERVDEGDLIGFVDDRNRPIVSGTVVAKRGDQVHVRYVTPRPERRPPRVGDLAVHHAD